MADVAVVIGHHPDAPGAVLELCNWEVAEYDFWAPFARALAYSLAGQGIDAVVVERPNPQPDAGLTTRVNATGARCAIELHFNGAEDPGAAGTEMLYWSRSAGGRDLADLLQDRTTKALGTASRGTKGKGKYYPFLRDTTMPAVICEPAFGTNLGDAWRLLSGQAKLMTAYRQAITEWLDAYPHQ